MLLASSAEMLPTLRLLSSTVGFVLTAFLEGESWCLTKTGRQVLQDKMVTVYDKMGSVTDKP